MTLKVGDAGTWKQAKSLWVGDAGTWKKVKSAWVGDGGIWKKMYSGMPEFIGSSNAIQNVSGGTCTYAAGTTTGDLLICVIACDDSENNSGPAGWTFLGRDTDVTEVAVWAKDCAGETSVSIPGSTGGGGPSTVAEVYTFRGANVAGITGVNTGTNSPANTPVDNCLVFCVRGNTLNTNSDNQTSWGTGNLENPVEVGDYSYNDGWDVGFAALYGEMQTAGDPGSVTNSAGAAYLNFTIQPL
jgi:hypothetical protein